MGPTIHTLLEVCIRLKLSTMVKSQNLTIELLEKNCFLRRFHRKVTRRIVTPEKTNIGELGNPEDCYPRRV